MKNDQFPSFFLIGAMKAGTSSLHYYLDQHPGISMSGVKEPNYFSKSRSFLHKGQRWYKSLFPDNSNIKGESSTAYTKFPHIQGVPRRIYKKVREARFIYLLRDPVERTISHVHHDMIEGLIPPVQYIDGYVRQKENNEYVDLSKYMMQLDQYLKVFDKDQFLILSTEEMRRDPKATTDRVFEFLGLSGSLDQHVFDKKKNVSNERAMITNQTLYKRALKKELKGKLPKGSADKYREPFTFPGLSEEAKEDLVNDLQPDVERLENEMNVNFNWKL